MSLWTNIASLVADPPPAYAFEFSEQGIAFAHQAQTGFAAFEPGTLAVSPTADNLLRADHAMSVLGKIAPPNGAKRRRPAAVILPDFASRVSVLDFDSFPATPAEQLSLVRFRVKKTIPFDIDSAAVSYFVQSGTPGKAKVVGGKGKVEVVAVTVALEILARYEALFRGANFHPGEVTASSLAVLNLCHGQQVEVIARLTGRILTVIVTKGGKLKLFRCLPLEDLSVEEILAVLHPTLSYAEDELGARATKLLVCGLPASALQGALRTEVEIEPLRSPIAALTPQNAGLLGYLEERTN